VEPFIGECAAFPARAHDGQVDAWSQEAKRILTVGALGSVTGSALGKANRVPFYGLDKTEIPNERQRKKSFWKCSLGPEYFFPSPGIESVELGSNTQFCSWSFVIRRNRVTQEI
jgi:hypothetical protein